jgi:hypothetical protein
MRHLALLLTLVALVLTACGGDDDNGGGGNGDGAETTETQPAQTDTQPETTPPEDGGPASPEDEQAIKDAVLGYLIEGDCDTMTDKFVEDQTFQDNRREGCEQFEQLHEKPQYDAEDVNITDIRIQGTRATATIGDDVSDVEADYKLVKEGGAWRIDEVDL